MAPSGACCCVVDLDCVELQRCTWALVLDRIPHVCNGDAPIYILQEGITLLVSDMKEKMSKSAEKDLKESAPH